MTAFAPSKEPLLFSFVLDTVIFDLPCIKGNYGKKEENSVKCL